MAGNAVAEVHPKVILLDDVKVMWPNFAGEGGQYNAEGKRNFVVFLTPEMAEDFGRQGYNIKYLKPRDEDEGPPQAFVKINVNFESRNPPEIFLVNSKGKRQVTKHEAMILDWATYRRTDMVVTRYQRQWPDGRTTVTMYLQTFYGFLQEDELRERYNDIPQLVTGGAAEIEGASDVLVWQESSPEEIEHEKFLALER